MKKKFFLFSAIIILLATVVVLSGCGGGSKSHSQTSPYNGSITGVDTIPVDGDDFVPVDAWIKVEWPNSYYEPPSSFTFKLYEMTSDGWKTFKTIYKDEDSDPEGGFWWFAPEHNLAYDTDYKIVVTDDYNDSHTHYFITEPDPSRAQATARTADTSKYRPTGGGKSGGTAAEEHKITVRPK